MSRDTLDTFARYDDGSFSFGGFVSVVPDAERTDGETDEIEVIASTQRVALDGDVIELATWRTGQYLRTFGKGGPVLADHDPRRIIGIATRTKKDADEGVLRAWYRHRSGDSAHAVEARALRADGIRMPVSVRWIPGKVIRADELPKDDPLYRDKPIKIARPWGESEHMPRVHRHAVLREISETALPADPGAVAVRTAGGLLGIAGDASDLEATVRGVLADMIAKGDLTETFARAFAAVEGAQPKSIDAQAWGV